LILFLIIYCHIPVFSTESTDIVFEQNSKTKSFDPGSELDLSTLLIYAQDNNPALQGLYLKWLSEKETISQASYLPDPRLSYSYFIEPIQTKTGPQDQKVGLSQTFPWFGKLSLKEKIASISAESAYQDYIIMQFSIIEQIRNGFYEYSFLHEAITINQEHINLLKMIESTATTKFTTGDISQNNLIQIQIELERIEDQKQELEALRPAISANILADIGDNQANILPWPKKSDTALQKLDFKKLKALLPKENPTLKQISILEEKEAYAIDLAKKNFMPDITLGVDVIDVDGGENPAVAMVSINLPIWRNKLHASKREAINRYESIGKIMEDTENKLSVKLELAVYYYNDAIRKMILYKNSIIPKAQQAVDLSFKGFETGKTNFYDLLEAERTLLEFQLSEQQQKANALKKLAEVEKLLGTQVE
jgi:cobalt-zinc-cadmium efflux system outer membrane protein